MQSNGSRNIAFVGVLLLLAAVAIVLAVPPADQYEISLYDAYPGYFWALVIGALCAGLLSIVASVGTSSDRSWIFGLLVVFVTHTLLLLMPYVRGYQMYGRADVLSHLGFVKEITMTGGITGNIYSPSHLLVLVLTDATGADLMTIAMVVPVIFSGLYFGAMFYLLDHLFDDRDQFLLGLPFVILPVLGRAHLGYRPYDLSVMFIPLVVYLFVKSQRSPTPSVRSAFVVALVALLFYHPLTAFFVIGVFSLYVIGKHMPRVRRQYATPTNLLSLSAAVFVMWYSNFTGIILRFDRIYETLFGLNEGDPPIDAYAQTVEETSPALVDLLRVAIFTYGVEFVLFGLGFAFVGFTLLRRREYVPDTYITTFALTLLLFGVGGVVFLFTDLIIPPDRPFQIAKIGAVILVGQLFYQVRNRIEPTLHGRRLRTRFHGALTVVILLLVVLSVFSLYPSPLASSSNSQVTEMEVDGAAWLVQHGTGAEDISQFGLSSRRFFHALYGTRSPKPFTEKPLPDHFNYTEHEYLGQSYTNDTYVTITRKGRIVYPTSFPNYPRHWRFTPHDFDRLDRDRTTARVYDNGDYNQYLVDGTRTDAAAQAYSSMRPGECRGDCLEPVNAPLHGA